MAVKPLSKSAFNTVLDIKLQVLSVLRAKQLFAHLMSSSLPLFPFVQQQDMDIGSGKNLLPSISEDDEERGSDEEDKSPISTSPRSPLHSRSTTRFNFSRSVSVVHPRRARAQSRPEQLPPHPLAFLLLFFSPFFF